MVLGTVMSARKSALTLPLPLQFLAAWLAVWLGRALQEQVEYLKAENLLPREKLGTKRVMLTDAERRKLATLGKVLGRKGLAVGGGRNRRPRRQDGQGERALGVQADHGGLHAGGAGPSEWCDGGQIEAVGEAEAPLGAVLVLSARAKISKLPTMSPARI
jgi:hypothetical protein